MRRIVALDTETTGIELELGHRVIEIGCVELIERRPSGREFLQRVNPGRKVDPEARQVHGISDEDLVDKPPFAAIADELVAFLRGAEVVIHNAPFDVGFLDAEFARLDGAPIRMVDLGNVVDTLPLARSRWPGQRNTLDALCKRLGVDNSNRELHGALLDAQLLADVYLAMTAGQDSLDFGMPAPPEEANTATIRAGTGQRAILQLASAEERAAHEQWLDQIDRECGEGSVWRRVNSGGKA